jgi:hypothetical protein
MTELVQGLAKCISNEGMKGELQVGDVAYVQEIPNMRGHCVVLRDKKATLVGYHLERFELLEGE